MLLPVVKPDGFAQQQTRHHPRQQHQQVVSPKVGLGIHWDLDCHNSELPWLPCPLHELRPILLQGFPGYVSQPERDSLAGVPEGSTVRA